MGKRDIEKHQKAKQKKLSKLLDDTAKELTRSNYEDLTIGRRKLQLQNLLHLMRLLQENLGKISTVHELYNIIVSTFIDHLEIDAVALFEGNVKSKRFTVLAARGVTEDIGSFSAARLRNGWGLFTPFFITPRISPESHQKWLIKKFTYPVFVWCPVPCNEEISIILYLGNSSENWPAKEPFNDDFLEFMNIVTSIIPIHRRRILETEKTIRQKEDYINFLLEIIRTAPVSIVAADKDKQIMYVNDAAEKLYGYSREEMLGQDNGMFCAEPLHDKLREDIIRIIGRDGVWRGEVLSRKKNNEIFHCRVTVYMLKDNDGNFLAEVGILEDITEQKKAAEEKKKFEEKINQFQKMESIGRLAGGIAHDFNNIITSVMGYAEMLSVQFAQQDNPAGKKIDAILRSAERAAELTEQLLGFARKGRYNPEPLHLHDVVDDVLNVCGTIFEKNIEILYNINKNLMPVEADRNQLEQVLTNIIINARDAMQKGGRLTIAGKNVRLNEKHIKDFPGLRRGNYVKISIADTGIGMSNETKNRIFEPFYTTKVKGKGTGLGLATVYGIIENHRGYIQCDSEPGQGTTFTIYLPATYKKVRLMENDASVVTGNETILIVDDEEDIRLLTGEQLESLGYRVLLAKDGRQAVDIYKKEKSDIDLVILDMIMPKMAGRETFHTIRKINPAASILLMSGYSQDDKANRLLREGALGFLKKPFKLHELSKIISRIIK